MDEKFVKIESSEFINVKKEIISAELNMIYMLKAIKNYRVLKEREGSIRNKINAVLVSLRNKIDYLESTFPNPPERQKIKRVKKRIETEISKDFEKELEEIKEKLKRLG